MFSLSNPVVLLSLIVFLPSAGALAICFLPKGRDELVKRFALITSILVLLLTVWMAIPVRPTITVNVPYEGADAETVETGVTEVLEKALAPIKGVNNLASESADGESTVTVTFDYGEDANKAFERVAAQVKSIALRGEFPVEAGIATVEPFDLNTGSPHYALGTAGMQHAFSLKWIPTFNIYYSMGVDGISFPLVLLTSFLSVLAIGASWPIKKHLRAYYALFLLLETGMLGVFMSLDFFLFYVFWEVMLLPMYFLIGIWGGPRREYAAIKFFLFTLVGSVLMLVALLMLYFASDLGGLQETSPQQLASCNLHEDEIARIDDAGGEEVHTFNIMALAQIGQQPDSPFGDEDNDIFGMPLGWWAFLLLFIGFVVKLPAVPVHTWLPDAHVEAPTPISMILAGVLLKMGGYGVLRICYPICPQGALSLAWLVCTVGLVSMVYGAFAALAQTDFKRLVAYSSVSHMGYVLLGIGVWSAASQNNYNTDAWTMGVSGAMFQMIAHGISSAGMFFLVGVIYDRVHHRDLNKFGGLFAKMPVYGGISIAIFFAGMGLPGLCGFWGEIYVVLATWQFMRVLAIIAAGVVILTAGYILWTIQRVYLGPEYKGPHGEAIVPMTRREIAIAAPLVALALLFGVYPRAILDYTQPTLQQMTEDLTDWREAEDQATEPEADAEPANPKSADLGSLPPRQGPIDREVMGTSQLRTQPVEKPSVIVSQPDALPEEH